MRSPSQASSASAGRPPPRESPRPAKASLAAKTPFKTPGTPAQGTHRRKTSTIFSGGAPTFSAPLMWTRSSARSPRRSRSCARGKSGPLVRLTLPEGNRQIYAAKYPPCLPATEEPTPEGFERLEN